MVSSMAIVGFGVRALVQFSLPIVAYLICRGWMKLSARNILVGAGCFVVALVLGSLLNRYVLIVNPQTASWLKTHLLERALYGALSAGLFEETARFSGLSLLARREDGAGVAYGIGHGGTEVIFIGGVGSVIFLVVALLFNHGLVNVSHLTAPFFSTLTQTSFALSLLAILERSSALIVQIALSLLVWRAVRMKRPSLFAVAILIHTAFDTPFTMQRVGFIHLNQWMLEGIFAAIALVLLAAMLSRLPPRAPAESAFAGLPAA